MASMNMYPDIKEEDLVTEVHEIVLQKVGHVPVAKGDFQKLPKNVKIFVSHCIQLMKPRAVYLCDGSQEEADEIIHKLLERGTLTKLKYPNSYLCRTDPADVARVEAKTFICTPDQYETVPHVKEGVQGILGHWMGPKEMSVELNDRFPGCMAGRMMYVIPFSMGPIGSPLSKIGIQVTDSNYVLLCMRIMTRVSPKILNLLSKGEDFVKCIHSMGCPRPVQRRVKNHWPCNPEKVLITHFPHERKIKSYGSGYGGNSLLGKKCFALRIASVIARDEGWMAEHMLISGITPPKGEEMFIAAAFPSACGKTNLAMTTPTVPGFQVRCVGDDIAWMRFDDKTGELRGINPEAGFFGVAPGTNNKTNPNAVASFQANSIFTNVAETADGSYYWEGLEDEVPHGTSIKTWLGQQSFVGNTELGPASHPNARFTCPASQCPIIHPRWEDPEGVPISAIIFGGRRPKGVPLVFEAKSWEHGVMIGACVKSESTAAAEFKGKKIMHDPMAMRPFMGYNFGHYLEHWLSLPKPGRKMPKIFHVNWFRTDVNGKFLWPGFGENIRVIDWILRRCKGEDIAVETPIGFVPKPGTINMEGLGAINEQELFSQPCDYWLDDTRESMSFLRDQVGCDTPPIIFQLLEQQEKAFQSLGGQQQQQQQRKK